MASITVSEIQEVYGEQQTSLDSAKQTALKNIAERITEDVFGGKVAANSEIEGDDDDFAKYLGAHLWEIAERKRLNNEFQTGFSADVAGFRSDPQSALSGTPYGNVCLMMLRQRSSISVVRSYF